MRNTFFSMLRYTALLAVVVGMFALNGCDDEEAKPTKTVYELLSEDASLAKIKAQVDLNADLKAKLMDPAGTYTFFAPNDLAMSAILTTLGLTDFSSISPATLSLVLNYHLVAKSVTSADLTNGATITTAQGENITVEVNAGTVKLKTGATTNGTVIATDIKGTNGVLHVVGDYPLVPPTIGALIVQTLGKAAQPILLSASFSTLASAILKADAGKPSAETIVGQLIARPQLTFFAPPNQVFAAASLTAASKSAAEWDAIIRGHITTTTVATLSDGTLTTINGKTLTTTSASVKGVGNTSAVPVVVASKITTQNGVIFPIGGIIINP